MQIGFRSYFMTKKKSNTQLRNRIITSIAIILGALGLTYARVPGLEQTVVVVSGTELQEPLQQLKAKFEQANPNIKLDLKFQGSQDMVNKFVDQKNDFKATVLIPASRDILTELGTRLKATNNTEPFYDSPRPVAKTILVGIAWPERGKVLFPNGRFEWQRLEQVMQAKNWASIGGDPSWGSFDFVTTDPNRSNSGQVTLDLWAQSKLGGTVSSANLNNPAIQTLFSLVKKSVYQPPRSTDILLQEFISRGPNEADVATVYESIALYRWQQSAASQGKAYQIYYLNPTVETTATAAIVRRDVDGSTANAAKKFLDFITQPEQQAVLVQYGFRPVNNSVDLKAVPNSPWSQNIPGAEIKHTVQTLPPPNSETLREIQRQWERAN
jgi:ABC-type molybdate transport system substrate-binding protein